MPRSDCMIAAALGPARSRSGEGFILELRAMLVSVECALVSANRLARACILSAPLALLTVAVVCSIVQVRRQTFKDDFASAVRPASGAMRALSSHAIRPASWGGYLSHDEGRVSGTEGADIRHERFAMATERLVHGKVRHAYDGAEAGTNSHADTDAHARMGPSRSGTAGQTSAASDSSAQGGRGDGLSAVTSLLQRSLLMPTSTKPVAA